MTTEQLREAADALKAFGHGEVYRVLATCRVFRTLKNGEPLEITVELRDAWPAANPQVRYQCVLRSDDGRVRYGNWCESIKTAIMIAGWPTFED